MKQIVWLIPLICLSCSGLHMKSEERFLSATGNDSRIFIITYLGVSTEKTALSMLISPPGNTISQSTAIVNTFSEEDKKNQFFYNDSLFPVSGNTFPSVIKKKPGTASGFDFYLYRNKLLFSGFGNQSLEIAYAFTKQTPFEIDSSQNGIHGITPLKTSENGTLFIHVLDHVDSLFVRKPGICYFWVDFVLHDQPQTLYFSQEQNGTTTLLYSTTKLTVTESQHSLFQLITESGQAVEFRQVGSNPVTPGKSGYNSLNALIFDGEKPIGNALIYLLAKP